MSEPGSEPVDDIRIESTTPQLGRPPDAAWRVFGEHLPSAERFARRLATDGVQRGLIGPREVPRLWDRHLVTSAVLAQLIEPAARVVDVGSGAGLPGIPIAIARPDLCFDLVEPMARRVAFLNEMVDELALTSRVRVVRGRAPEAWRELGAVSWVVARAVAPLDRLVEWCSPLVGPSGRLIAVKGERAADEVAAARVALRRAAMTAEIVQLGEDIGAPTRAVVLTRQSKTGTRVTKRELRGHRSEGLS